VDARLVHGRHVSRRLVSGALAGAAGTAALHAATYVDMAVRGRPPSTTPEETVERLAERMGVEIPGAGPARENRLSGLGALGGILAGTTAGALLGLAGVADRPAATRVAACTGVAMLVGNGPMTLLRVTSPSSWSRADWLSDLLPHLVFGLVTASTLARTRRDEDLRARV
jgi:hypothetical protein